MTAIDQVKNLVGGMNGHDRAAVLEHVARAVAGEFPGIERSADVCGGEPRIVRTRIPVWVLAQARGQGLSDDQLLRAYPSLRAEDLAFAWAYCELHGDDIEQQIRENEAA